MLFDRRLASFQVTSGVGAKQHQFFYHLRMAGRVLNRNWTALRNSQQGGSIKLKRVYHDLEVTDPSVESKAPTFQSERPEPRWLNLMTV